MFSQFFFPQVLGEKAFEKMGKWFISLHFSDQLAGSYKKVLSFKFVLPDANNMADMTKLVALVPFYIDLVGRYKLSSHVSTNFVSFSWFTGFPVIFSKSCYPC